MKGIVKILAVAALTTGLLGISTSAQAYCRWVPGHYMNGYYVHGHKVCGGGNYYRGGYYHRDRYCGWRYGRRVCWYR